MLVPEGAKAGKITKPYGLRGEVNIILEPQAGNSIEPDNPLFIDIDGQRVPFFVEAYEQTSDDTAIIKFEFVKSVEEARELNGCEVIFDMVQNSVSHNPNSDFIALVGYNAFDQALGYLGKIEEYIPNDFNSVFVVIFQGKELLIPAAKELIDTINHKKQAIHFILPEGLTLV